MEFLEIPLFDDDFYKLVVRFAFNLFFVYWVVILALYRNERRRDFVFSAVMMNIMVFFICFSLKKIDLGLGMALGLFAIFAILRYRTDQIRTRDMTYLFIMIGLAVINALSNKKTSYAELILINGIVLYASVMMERFYAGNQRFQKQILYTKVELLAPERYQELLIDLKEQTGFDVLQVEIDKIDLKRELATLTVWYRHKLDQQHASQQAQQELDS